MSGALSSETLQTFLIIFSILNIFYLGTTFLVWSQRERECVKKRLAPFLLVTCFCTQAASNLFLIRCTPEIYNMVPNLVFIWLYYILVPMWCGANVIRDVYVVFLQFLNSVRFDPKALDNLSWANRFILRAALAINIFIKGKSKKTNEILAVIDSSRSESRMTNVATNLATNLATPIPDSSPASGAFENMAMFTSFNSRDLGKLLAIFGGIGILFALLVTIVFPENRSLNPLMYPPISERSFVAIFFLIGLIILFKPILIVTQRRFNDTYGFYAESLGTFVIYWPFFIPYILRVPFFFGIDRIAWFIVIATLLQMIYTIFPVVFDILDQRKLKPLDGEESLSMNQESFQKVLASKTDLYPKLKAVLADILSIENALFHESYLEFVKNGYPKTSLNVFKSKFIVRGSPMELNLPNTLSDAFISSLNRDDFEESLRQLEKIHTEVLAMIFSNGFPRFLVKHQHNLMKSRQLTTINKIVIVSKTSSFRE